MYKIKILTIGKNKEEWLLLALQEYEKRLSTQFRFEWILARDRASLKTLIEKEKNYIALDPQGQQWTSDAFSPFLFSTLQNFDSRLSFVIGGDEGLDDETKHQAAHLLSFSKMTFTHQMTRLILLEQIYRASEIQRGSPYHK